MSEFEGVDFLGLQSGERKWGKMWIDPFPFTLVLVFDDGSKEEYVHTSADMKVGDPWVAHGVAPGRCVVQGAGVPGCGFKHHHQTTYVTIIAAAITTTAAAATTTTTTTNNNTTNTNTTAKILVSMNDEPLVVEGRALREDLRSFAIPGNGLVYLPRQEAVRWGCGEHHRRSLFNTTGSHSSTVLRLTLST